jgi:hypothetical protein
MKSTNSLEINNGNNISSFDSLPKINMIPQILKTTPNLTIKKTSNKHNKIPILSKPYANETVKSSKILNKRYKPNKTIDMIHKLNLESNFREIFVEELKKKEKREKINSNQEVIDRRLGLFKKEDSSSEEEKNKEKEIKYYKDASIEKLNVREREKKVEKNYKKSLTELGILEKQVNDFERKIKNLSDKIDGHKLEINVIDHYGKSIDKKNVALESPVNARLEKLKKTPLAHKKSSKMTKIIARRASVSKDINFEMEAKLVVKKYQRDEKEKKIKYKVDSDEKQLENLNNQCAELKEKYNNQKKKVYDLKSDLINIYHTTLFEGLDFRGEGLVRIILNIWNLGENIDMNFIPSYLDNKAIEYLFKKARQIVEMDKMKKSVKESEKDFVKNIKQWKNENHLNTSTNKKLKNYFFKTRIIDNDDEEDSFLDYYPMTKLFMNNYKKTHESNMENEDIVYSKKPFKSLDIPNFIIEKNNKIINLRNKLQILKSQIEMDKKAEVIRLCKEFLFNSYEERYKVCIDTIIGALFGEGQKDDMLNYYYTIKKENRDNLKKIEFYSPLFDRIKNK